MLLTRILHRIDHGLRQQARTYSRERGSADLDEGVDLIDLIGNRFLVSQAWAAETGLKQHFHDGMIPKQGGEGKFGDL